MDSAISSDDSSDSDMKSMKNQLTEFGLEEENLSKEEMKNLLKALRDSKSAAKKDETEPLQEKAEDEEKSSSSKSPPKMKRHYVDVKDLRMPWSILPSNITPPEKARALAVYIKLMAINNYRQARRSTNFAAWPPPIPIVEDTHRVQPLRSTRSGRSVPIYAGFDDDSSDLDFVVTKTKKRKVSSSDQNADGNYTNKVVSLKRRHKDENAKPAKESKIIEHGKADSTSSGSNVKPKRDLFTLIED